MSDHGDSHPKPRRRRALTEDERALWDAVARSVKPIKPRPRRTAAKVAAAKIDSPTVDGSIHAGGAVPLAAVPRLAPQGVRSGAKGLAARRHATETAHSAPVGMKEAPHRFDPVVSSRPSGPASEVAKVLTRRERTRVVRGNQPIAGRIDLHGLTQAEAHRALHRFVFGLHYDGGGVALVITGKGRTASQDRERGVLRRMVPQWLESPEFSGVVLGHEPAHIGHGGEGALYVRVRRRR